MNCTCSTFFQIKGFLDWDCCGWKVGGGGRYFDFFCPLTASCSRPKKSTFIISRLREDRLCDMSTAWTQKTVSLVVLHLQSIYVKMLKNAVMYIRCWILSKLMHFISHKLGHYALICYHQIFLKVLFDNILTRFLIAVLFSTTDLIMKGGVYSLTHRS